MGGHGPRQMPAGINLRHMWTQASEPVIMISPPINGNAAQNWGEWGGSNTPVSMIL